MTRRCYTVTEQYDFRRVGSVLAVWSVLWLNIIKVRQRSAAVPVGGFQGFRDISRGQDAGIDSGVGPGVAPGFAPGSGAALSVSRLQGLHN